MPTHQETYLKKPPLIQFIQILIYFAAVLNMINGIYSFGSAGLIKKGLCIAMILFGAAAVVVAARLNLPDNSRRRAAIILCGILVVLRIVEFVVWNSIGFVFGIILPIIIIWRLNSPEAKAWFK
ncbi:hypothetical protein EBB07_19165 [Paenibacillaceae bacterium]|nr:hypothetical protein EBB07_19165 [Paenibacillaceae bacterium]